MLKRDEAEKFLSIIKEGIENGYNLKECFQQAAKKLNKTEKTLCTYWYTDDYFEEMREKIKRKARFHHWNVEKDLELIKLIKKS